MKPKILKKGKTVIIDGFPKLIEIDGKLAEKIFGVFQKEQELIKGVSCAASHFITEKGLEAIRLSVGDSHVFRMRWGSESRSWDGWENRRIINGLFSEAKPTSKGGGCWLEVEIFDAKIPPITAEQAGYMEEL